MWFLWRNHFTFVKDGVQDLKRIYFANEFMITKDLYGYFLKISTDLEKRNAYYVFQDESLLIMPTVPYLKILP